MQNQNSTALPQTLPANFNFGGQGSTQASLPQTLPANFNFGGQAASSATPEGAGQIAGDWTKNVANFLFPILGDIGADVQGKGDKSFMQQVGDAGLSALPFIPGLGEIGEGARGLEAGAEGASALSKAYDAWKGLSTVTKGAATGYGAGVASNLSQGKGIGQSLNPLDMNNIVGTLTGGIGAKVIPKLFTPFINNLTQKGALSATTDALEEEATRLKTNKALLNNLPNQGKPALSLIARTGALPEVKGTNFDSTAAIENLQNRIASLGQVRAQALDKIGTTQSLDGLAQIAKNQVSTVPEDATDAEQHLVQQRMFSGESGAMTSKIDKTVADIKTAHGLVPDENGVIPDMNLSASQVEAMKESQMANSGIFKRSGAIGDQNGASMLGFAAKDAIEKMASESGFPGMEEYNNVIKNHYNAIKILQKMDGQTVKGGRLGNMLRGHTMGVIGAGASALLGGGFWGTLAGGVGSEGASHLFSKILGNTTLSNPLRDAILSKIETEDPEVVQELQHFVGGKGKVSPMMSPGSSVIGRGVPLISSLLQGATMRGATGISGLIDPKQP